MKFKKVLKEQYRIKTLMGINESINILTDFENLNDSENCNFYDNLNPPEGVDYWFQEKYQKMTETEKLSYKKIINDFTIKTLDEVKGYFTTTYGSGNGYNKLLNNFILGDNKDYKILKLLEYIEGATVKCFFEKTEVPYEYQPYIEAWAYTKLDKIYVNVFNFWDGTLGGKKSMYDTILHETNHVMQNYMLNNPTSYKKPFPILSDGNQVKTNHKEIHSNFQTIRKLFGINVEDSAIQFVNKISEYVKNKTLYWDLGDIMISGYKICFLEKKNGVYVDTNITNKDNFMEKFMFTLRFTSNDGDEHIADISYLFSEFYKTATTKDLGFDLTIKNVKVVYVDLMELANLNDDFVQNYNNSSIENLS
jgi:hypothetical protein